MTGKVLIHTHVYYHEMWHELAACVENIDLPYDLFVTTVCDKPDFSEAVKTQFPNAKIIICENKGFDIAPFFKALDSVSLDDYSYVVKLHSKRNVMMTCYINGNDLSGETWHKKLLKPFKTPENWKKTLSLLEQPETGMVAEASLILNRVRDGNPQLFKKAKHLLTALNLTPAKTNFVAGTMFAAKASLFKCFHNKENVFLFTQSERGKDQMPYVCERLLGMVVSAQGYEIKPFEGTMSAVSLKWFIQSVVRILFYKKITPDKTLIKVFKIPVYVKRYKKIIPVL